jgi:hypothetical protein
MYIAAGPHSAATIATPAVGAGVPCVRARFAVLYPYGLFPLFAFVALLLFAASQQLIFPGARASLRLLRSCSSCCLLAAVFLVCVVVDE